MIESVADAAAAASVTPKGRSAVHALSSERPVPLKLPRARAAALTESVSDVAAAAIVTPDMAIDRMVEELIHSVAAPSTAPAVTSVRNKSAAVTR